MPATKVFHIYAKNECLYHSLTEEQFKNTWESLRGMVGLLHTDYTSNDLTYEECVVRTQGGGGSTTNEPEGLDSY